MENNFAGKSMCGLSYVGAWVKEKNLFHLNLKKILYPRGKKYFTYSPFDFYKCSEKFFLKIQFSHQQFCF